MRRVWGEGRGVEFDSGGARRLQPARGYRARGYLLRNKGTAATPETFDLLRFLWGI